MKLPQLRRPRFWVPSLIALASISFAQPPPAADQMVHVGSLEVRVSGWSRGIGISLDGVSISAGSSMVITRPPWAPHHYLGPAPEAVREMQREVIPNAGERITLKHRGSTGNFEGRDIITVTRVLPNPDGDGGPSQPGATQAAPFRSGFGSETPRFAYRVERLFEGVYTGDDPDALIQWQVAALNPALIVGRPFTATLRSGETREGVVPVIALQGDAAATALANGFTRLEFDSRIGPLAVEVEAERPLICYDYRKSRWADPGKPLFWLGDMGTRFPRGETIRYRIVFHVPEARDHGDQNAPAARGVASVSTAHDAQTTVPEIRIVPRPKEIQVSDKPFYARRTGAITPPLLIQIGSENEVERAMMRAAAEEYARHVAALGGERLKVVESGAPSRADATLRFERTPEGGQPLPREGYEFSIRAGSPGDFLVRANDEAGFRHAVQTLKQLTRAEGRKITLRSATGRDWPSLAYRGVHMFTGGQGTGLHEKLIREVVAGLKMNHIVLEAEYVAWDCCPNIHHPEFGMPKDDVRRLLEVCREVGVEVTPMINSPGHAQWIFTNGQNLDLAEDPEARWAYCVTNPRTYEFLFQIYEETLELFKPKMLHIGHDEFADRGRVPYRESSKPYTVAQLFMMDTLRLHGWLKERGVRTMMWGDMLLAPGEAPDACHAKSPEEARAKRDELPDDIIITDWHYVADPPEKFTSLALLQGEGHEVIASPWSRPLNVLNFARAAYANQSLGLLQTTWAGYSLDPGSFAREMPQYAAWVLAAEAAWNADNPLDHTAWPYGQVFLDRMELSSLKLKPPSVDQAFLSAWTTDLSTTANYSLKAGDDRGWFGLGPEHDLATLPHGDLQLAGLRFRVGDAAAVAAKTAVVAPGKLAFDLELPSATVIQLRNAAGQDSVPASGERVAEPASRPSQGTHATRLAFLHTTEFAAQPATIVGIYEVIYADGRIHPITLEYGKHILHYADASSLAPDAPLVWTGHTADGEPAGLRVFLWDNPRPDKAIEAIVVRSGAGPGSLLLLGLTGLNSAAN